MMKLDIGLKPTDSDWSFARPPEKRAREGVGTGPTSSALLQSPKNGQKFLRIPISLAKPPSFHQIRSKDTRFFEFLMLLLALTFIPTAIANIQ